MIFRGGLGGGLKRGSRWIRQLDGYPLGRVALPAVYAGILLIGVGGVTASLAITRASAKIASRGFPGREINCIPSLGFFFS